MGGSASYRLAKKIANAKGRGAPQSEIDELERQHQLALATEKEKRQEAKQPQQPKEKTFRDKVNEAQTKEELMSVLSDKYSYIQSGVISRNDTEMVKRAVRTLDELEEQYPFMKGAITGLEFAVTPGSPAAVHARFSSQKGLVSQNFKFGEGWDVSDNPSFYSDDRRGHNPPNRTPESIVAHEFGHAIGNLILGKRLEEASNRSIFESIMMIDDIKNNRGLAYLEKRAVATLGYKQPAAVRGKISGYAKEARRYGSNPTNESFAEAFADVYSNGENASDVSKAYVNALLSEVQNVIGG